MKQTEVLDMLEKLGKEIEDIGDNGDITFGCETCTTVRQEAADIVWEYWSKLKKGD